MERRGSIVLEAARVLSNTGCAGGQHVLRVHAPEIARRARPGQFLNLQCDPTIPLRRPMSIMRAASAAGWIEMLYKAQGYGTRLLALRQPGDDLSLLGPIGRPFKLAGYRKRPLLLGGGVGIPPMIGLVEHIRTVAPAAQPLLCMGSEVPFPFTPRPSAILVPGLPADVIAAMPLLEDWRIPSRLASSQGFAGCFQGLVTELAGCWLEGLTEGARAEVELFACGPTPMLRAVQQLAARFDLPCELSLEERMACAVGGCAGCTVAIDVAGKLAMRRVCVDGPVFDAAAVRFPA
ncbi:MAG: dihydroorotate dehydrogenase electron transfer subunit [Gammaproteobacteria bacterium]|nr:dihydroorotate dehydrogenase electron transfer subunit [Gammaproteobacteria bacterium]